MTRVEGGFFAKELNLLTHPCKELIYHFIPRPKMGSGCKRGGGGGGGGRSGGRGSLMVIGVEQGKGGGRRGPKGGDRGVDVCVLLMYFTLLVMKFP